MAIERLEECYDAKTASERLKIDIDTDIVSKIEALRDFLYLKTDDSFDKAFIISGTNPLKYKRNEIIEDMDNLIDINKQYKVIIKQRFWAKRLRDLQEYREYLNSELSSNVTLQQKLVNLIKSDSNYKGLQSSSKYPDYLKYQDLISDIKKKITVCDSEIATAKDKVSRTVVKLGGS